MNAIQRLLARKVFESVQSPPTFNDVRSVAALLVDLAPEDTLNVVGQFSTSERKRLMRTSQMLPADYEAFIVAAAEHLENMRKTNGR
jgi:hypothetical protein